ncbi:MULTISPECIES: hypothetical protein [unclassified Variovorax]|jgi:hypothetical protein|uniref:hypothetical protein n=1 Tax=unclassified Variovorax TaxID=663243 RepID=UPI000F7F5F32|nr:MULTISPECIES: hypothetical protein [unclassified Variovorax]RSZ38555.1 hypothetical protein EJO70_20780 [Variovorax sp. 553]RSZ38995.1 hypothetical protein EJO71_18470 [Variovorax sp. 679]
MTEPFPHESGIAQRLPRDLALVTVVIDIAMVAVNMAIQLWPDSPDSEQLRSAYALPGVWIPMVFSIGMAWVLAAALAWSHGRNALEKWGTQSVAALPQPRIRYAVAYIVVLVLNFHALSPLLYDLQLLFMPGGRLHEFFGSPSMRAAMPVFMFLQSIAQLVVLALGVWVSAWFALRAGRAALPEMQHDESLGASPRRAVALVGASVFASLQMWIGAAVSRWTSVTRDLDGPELLVAWVLPPLAAFALAFWGGWLGAAPVVSRVRPFRAVGAAVLTFVLVQVGCVAFMLLWLMLAVWLHGFNSAGSLVSFVAALVLIYSMLVVVLTRVTTRVLYRRYL